MRMESEFFCQTHPSKINEILFLSLERGLLGNSQHGKSFFLHNYYFFTHLHFSCVFVHFNTFKRCMYQLFPWHLLECTFCKFSSSFRPEISFLSELYSRIHLKCSPLHPRIHFKFFLPFQTKQSSSAIIFDSMVHFLS